MGWRDRDYNQGREAMYGFFSSPASFLQFSIPLITRPGLTVRLHFWLLLAILFSTIGILLAREPLYFIPFDAAILIGFVMWHELGHRVFARWVGGNHWEWVLWPLGGMVPPTCPRRPWPTFVAHVGGIVFTFLAMATAVALLLTVFPAAVTFSHSVLSPFTPAMATANIGLSLAYRAVYIMLSMGFYMILINLFPCYWFDGGYLWQSVLWPKLGLYRAIIITCIAGMVLAVPFFVLALASRSFMGMVLWALIFADCFNRRRQLVAAGPGVVDEDDTSYNYMDTPPTRRRKVRKGWFKTAARKAAKEQAEQAKIDAILAKVHDKGLHSLTWWEKRTLKRATDRQRQQDLAERL